MKIQIENLRAQMMGVQLNNYQKGLALDEYYKLLDYVEELEQLTMLDVVGQSEKLRAFREWTQENLNEKDIVTQHAIDSYLESL